MDGFPLFSRHLVPQNVGNIIFVCYFLNIGLGSKKSQCSSHFSKQSIPGLFYLEPHRKVNATTLELRATNFKNLKQNRPTCFQTLTFCRNMDFQKPWIRPSFLFVFFSQNGFIFVLPSFGPQLAGLNWPGSWPGSLGRAL